MRKRAFAVAGVVLLVAVLILSISMIKRDGKSKQGPWLYDTAEELTRRHATMQEVREVLGQPRPDAIFYEPGEILWDYDGRSAEGRRVYGMILEFDPATLRIRRMSTTKTN